MSRLSREAQTAGWMDGDPVSHLFGGVLVTGKVVKLKRNSDGQPFFMVQILGGGQIGLRVWPDSFVLGHGRIEKYCPGCQRPYRTNDREQDFCLSCDRQERGTHGYDDSRGRMRTTLRGTATRTLGPKPVNTATAEEIAADIAARDSESPF